MNEADYTIQLVHQDDGNDGWRIEVYDDQREVTHDDGSPPGNVILAIENMSRDGALSTAEGAIKRHEARTE